jgi:hypothetical protein
MTHEELAERLLFPLWRCVSADFKEKYKVESWGMFENFLSAAACSEDLPKFLEKFKGLCPMNWQHEQDSTILEMLKSGHDETVLSLLRSECSYLVLLTRDLNNQYKEQFKNKENAHLVA